MALAQWKSAFGCLIRDETAFRSLLRTALSGSLPAPFVSRTADVSAPLEVRFALEMGNAAFAAWEQWYVYDLHDGALPFQMFLPWGTAQPSIRARLLGDWSARRTPDALRWMVNGALEIERESLPKFSGGAI